MRKKKSSWTRGKKPFYASDNLLNANKCKKTTELNYFAFDEVFFCISTLRQHCDAIQRPHNSSFSWKVVLFYAEEMSEIFSQTIFQRSLFKWHLDIVIQLNGWFFMAQRNLSVKLYDELFQNSPKRIMNTRVILMQEWCWKFETKIRILELNSKKKEYYSLYNIVPLLSSEQTKQLFFINEQN